MVTKTFNSLNDDIKITATNLRSKEDNNLTLETSNNLIISSDNLTLNANGDLSVNNIYVQSGISLEEYITNIAGSVSNVITLNSDASLANLDVTQNLKVNGNLTVHGTTTTINSTQVDISDVAITLASNLLDPAHLTETYYAGLDISSIASLKYYPNTWQFTTSGASTTLKVDDSNVLLAGALEPYYTKAQLQSGNLDLSFQNIDISGKLDINGVKLSNVDAGIRQYFKIATSQVSINDIRSDDNDISINNLRFSNGKYNGIKESSLAYNFINEEFSLLKDQITDINTQTNLVPLNVHSIKFNRPDTTDRLEISSNYIPTTYSTYKFKTKDELPTVLISGLSGDEWIQDPSYTITTNPFRSNKSAIKIDFKINYICSQEAEQYISFKVYRIEPGIALQPDQEKIVFEDISLGNAMGVTAKNIYYGNYIDVPDTQWSNNENIYYLAFKVSKGSDQSLDISSGIYGNDHNYYNYMSVQELYIP